MFVGQRHGIFAIKTLVKNFRHTNILSNSRVGVRSPCSQTWGESKMVLDTIFSPNVLHPGMVLRGLFKVRCAMLANVQTLIPWGKCERKPFFFFLRPPSPVPFHLEENTFSGLQTSVDIWFGSNSERCWAGWSLLYLLLLFLPLRLSVSHGQLQRTTSLGVVSPQLRCVCVWWVGARCFWHQWAAGLCVCGAVTPSTCMLFGSTSKLPAVAMLTWTWPPSLREINTFPSLWLCSLGSKLEMWWVKDISKPEMEGEGKRAFMEFLLWASWFTFVLLQHSPKLLDQPKVSFGFFCPILTKKLEWNFWPAQYIVRAGKSSLFNGW